MLVVEGTDGVGKTTLCKKLLGRLPTHVYAHFTRLPAGFDYYWGYTGRMSRFIVQDRFHMSEIVYSVVRGVTSPLDRYTYSLVDARLRQLGGYTILVTADEDLVRFRWDESQMYDLEKTLAAGREFNTIRKTHQVIGTGIHGDRQVDVDFNFHCSQAQPYVTDNAIDRIIEEYRRRQSTLDRVTRDRPASL